MTREQLEKEAREYLAEHSEYSEVFGQTFVAVDTLTAMVDFAEPREKRIAELEKENAELKDEWQEQVQKATDEGYARTLQTMQLSKAKEIIRDFIAVAIDYIDKEDKNYSYIAEAEQFIKESE